MICSLPCIPHATWLSSSSSRRRSRALSDAYFAPVTHVAMGTGREVLMSDGAEKVIQASEAAVLPTLGPGVGEVSPIEKRCVANSTKQITASSRPNAGR